jgi:molybdopterin converting factor small subunit
MKVNLKCFSSLTESESCDYRTSRTIELEDGQTVGDLANHAGIPRENVKIAFVNHRKSTFETVLRDGDQVGLAPAVGGM